MTEQSRTGQGRAEHSKSRQSRAEKGGTGHSRAKQSRTEQKQSPGSQQFPEPTGTETYMPLVCKPA